MSAHAKSLPKFQTINLVIAFALALKYGLPVLIGVSVIFVIKHLR